MKQRIIQLAILVITLVPVAFSARAYTPPTAAPYSSNTDAPLDISSNDQIKNGGLSVFAFHDQGDAEFRQSTFLQGMIRGGTPTTTAPTSITIESAVAASGTVTTNTLQSDSLLGTGSRSLCADTNGTYVVCGTPAPVCGNSAVETGEQCDHGSANGTAGNTCSSSCNTVASDFCANITGSQASLPSGATQSGLDCTCPATYTQNTTTGACTPPVVVVQKPKLISATWTQISSTAEITCKAVLSVPNLTANSVPQGSPALYSVKIHTDLGLQDCAQSDPRNGIGCSPTTTYQPIECKIDLDDYSQLALQKNPPEATLEGGASLPAWLYGGLSNFPSGVIANSGMPQGATNDFCIVDVRGDALAHGQPVPALYDYAIASSLDICQ